MKKSHQIFVNTLSIIRKFNNSNNGSIKFIGRILHYLQRVIYSCDIGMSSFIPENCEFHHCGLGCVIGNNVIFGNNCQIYQNVTIGSKELYGEKNPRIGDNVIICSGSILLGDITIGNNSIIAAGSVVLHSVPENVLVAGNPAVIRKELHHISN